MWYAVVRMNKTVSGYEEMGVAERERLIRGWFRKAEEGLVGSLVAGRKPDRCPTLVLGWSGGRQMHCGFVAFVREPGK